MTVPPQPKLYHILHVDRLDSIIADGFLWSDAEVARHGAAGTAIGMSNIKHRRLQELTLDSHPGLHVGECVPFYFCPRSVMLYVIGMANHPELAYRGGQDPIIHLEVDLHTAVDWANLYGLRWAFTLCNAGSRFFEDRADLARLHEIDWAAIQARNWSTCKDGKQAEFLMEERFPWHLVERIGVHSRAIYKQVLQVLASSSPQHTPRVEVRNDWYY